MGVESPVSTPNSTVNDYSASKIRRGSISSLASRTIIGKDVLASTLDDIHISASRSDALTSFHDYDGGRGPPKAKDSAVGGGVTGLYRKLKQSVVPSSAPQERPGSSAGRSDNDSTKRDVASKSSGRTANTGPKPSLSASGSTMTSDSTFSPRVDGTDSDLLESSSSRHQSETKARQTNSTPGSRGSNEASGTIQDAASISSMLDAARGDHVSLPGTDAGSHSGSIIRSISSTGGISGHLGNSARLEPVHQMHQSDEEAIDDSDDGETPGLTMPQTAPVFPDRNSQARPKDSASVSSKSPSINQPTRPPVISFGPSHLPNYAPSQSSSPAETLYNVTGDSTRDPSPSYNINAALQRKRVSTMHLAPTSHRATRRVLAKEFWMKDENAKGCHQCGQSFSTFRRKHHCRTCGNIFDSKCTSLVSGKPFGQPGTIRLCKTCETINYDASDDDDSTVFSDDGEEISRKQLPQVLPGLREGELLSIDTTDFGFSQAADEIASPFIGIPTSRRNREAKRRSAVIEFDTPAALARPTSSHSLISLSHRPRSSSHRRRHSRHQNGRTTRSSVDERAPFHQDGDAKSVNGDAYPAFHQDSVIDPDLAAYLSDDGSDDGTRSLASAMHIPVSASPADRGKSGLSSFLPSALARYRPRTADKSVRNVSIKGVHEDDQSVRASYRHSSDRPRSRHQSFGSISHGRPSPRRSRINLLNGHSQDDLHQAQTIGSRGRSPSNPHHVVCSADLSKLPNSSLQLNSASLEHLRKLLHQLVLDAKLSSPHAWSKALMPIILQCAEAVNPVVQQGDDMDIRHYIKLKKIPGGKPNDTSYVSGVVFSKNVTLKSMSRLIHRPRIAIITFPIEYARHETHFMSLDPVIAQEGEYLQNLISRIAALRPQILLLQQHISGLALRLMEKAGITVVSNIKASVLAAVARVTGTTMIRSVDKLGGNPAQLGECDSFEVKTYAFDGGRKTYIYLSGCELDLGCTIVLRGADTKTLRRVKRITEFMCYVAYNLKLEDCLMRDQFVSIPCNALDHTDSHDAPKQGRFEPPIKPTDPDGLHASKEDTQPDQQDSKTPNKYERMEEEIRAKVLSASPFVVFMQPYILTQLRELERRLATFKTLRDQYAEADADEVDEEETIKQHFELVKPEMVHEPPSKDQPKTVRDYLHAVHEVQLEKAMHTYDTQQRQWDSFMSSNSNPFDPYSHQRIDVLFSTVSSITLAPCTPPELLGIGFYAGYNRAETEQDEDVALGQYVEDVCLSAGDTCQECDRKLYDHHRQYVHGYGQLSVSVSRQAARIRGLSESILMWSVCRICRYETQVSIMSELTWKYSFAKYLELSFWSSPLHARGTAGCKHDIHRDFLRCFGFQDMVVRFQYDAIDIYEIVVPRARITWKVEADLTMKNQQYTGFAQRLDAFTESIKNRLDSINIDTVDEKKIMQAQDRLEELRQKAESDHQELLQKLQRKYACSRYYEIVPLNRALRFMDEKAIAWDEAFNNFEQDFFPSETDIRQLATVQLRNMFLESQPVPGSVTGDSDVDEGQDGDADRGNNLRKLKSGDIPSEKAHDVLSSVVKELNGSPRNDEHEDGPASITATKQALLGHSLPPLSEEQAQVVENEAVKHLDLAVSPTSPDGATGEKALQARAASPEQQKPSHALGTSVTETEHPFATQPKPLSSGLLERIEQMRNPRVIDVTEESNESKIPRLVDLKRKETTTPAPPAPLLRAQSQPSHVPRLSTDSSSDSASSPSPPEKPVNNALSFDKRLSERLGVNRLVSKVGRVAPSLIPRSVPQKTNESNVSSVSALARHFEQMSREFEKERLKERRQRALRSRQARANPLASSRPVVEVYQNATDAVGEKGPLEQHVIDGEEAVPEREEHEGLGDSTEQTSTSPVQDDFASVHFPASVSSDVEIINSDDIGKPLSNAEMLDSVSEHSSSLTSPTTAPDSTDVASELSIPEHRKNVWLKYLADFWSKRSASGWANLEYPLHINEHVFEDSDIIVREDEPSSIIALSLASANYQHKMNDFRAKARKEAAANRMHHHEGASTSLPGLEEHQDGIEASLLRNTGTHMKYSFAHGQVKASCKIFYAESFDALRRRCGVSERFIESMSCCLKFDSKGGKTKSLFLKTLDNRFIIKSLQEVELKAFTRFAPDYFNFMSYTLFHGVPSVIAKMFGLFQVNLKNPATGVDFSYYLLVMENLFYERSPTRRFDLKGSMRNRKIESTGQADEVLLDENLVETIFESPLFVRENSRKLLQASVFNDTLWLCKQNVMDYSLMAGFDDPRKELVIGIIDCIRTFTFDKRLESWIKDRGKNKPTIVSPREYRNRFRVSMMQYALCAPSCWHQFTVQMAAPKTLKEREDKDETDTDADRN